VIQCFPTCKFLLLADDLRIFNVINNVSDSIDLQNCLNNFFQWCVHNDLTININKCNYISFSRSHTPFTFSYNINSIPLIQVSFIKDLGVIFSSDLSFNNHIDFICRKSMKILSFINRNTSGFSNITTLYISLVRSILEYASIVWSPFNVSSIERINKIQNEFLKMVSFRCGTNSTYLKISNRETYQF